jgi:hypothetical protein
MLSLPCPAGRIVTPRQSLARGEAEKSNCGAKEAGGGVPARVLRDRQPVCEPTDPALPSHHPHRPLALRVAAGEPAGEVSSINTACPLLSSTDEPPW